MYSILRMNISYNSYYAAKGRVASNVCKKCYHNVNRICHIRIVNNNYNNNGCTIIKHFVNNENVNGEKVKNLLLSNQNVILHFNCRSLTMGIPRFDSESHKPSSKVEVTVQELKKKQDIPESGKELVKKKKNWRQVVVDELIHYYHGFRLLFIDIRVSATLVWRILKGNTLTRREYRLLTRTVGDMFRLVPFSVFIFVPFMEFTLPFFIKFFPGMLPSTFQTSKEAEDKMKQSLKVKIEMAKFLQETLDNMTVQNKDRSSATAKDFSEWFQRVRTSGELVSNEEIMKFSKLFEDEITLDVLSRSQLIALCRVLEVQTLGTNNFLRFQLRMKLRSLAADDRMIQKEGIETLTLPEVQQACRARGMRAYGLSEERLREQLRQWLDLSLNEKVPPSLLLLSRALMLPESIPTSDKLKATISALPEAIVQQTKAAIGEKEGKIDHKVKLDALKEEVRKVKEEQMEYLEEKKKEQAQAKEELIDKAPIILTSETPTIQDKTTINNEKDQLNAKDVEIIECAIDTISKDKQLIVEKEELQELKAEMADYKEDVEDLNKVVSACPKPDEIKESTAARRLCKSVDKMINRLDGLIDDLQKKESLLKKNLENSSDTITKQTKEELIKIDDIMAVINKIKDTPEQSRIDQINKVLRKLDDDCDGHIKIEDALKVIEIIGKENVNLTDKQVDELIELLDKEEILEIEEKIEKALQKNKQKSQQAIEDKSQKGSKQSGSNVNDPLSKLNSTITTSSFPPPAVKTTDKPKQSQ